MLKIEEQMYVNVAFGKRKSIPKYEDFKKMTLLLEEPRRLAENFLKTEEVSFRVLSQVFQRLWRFASEPAVPSQPVTVACLIITLPLVLEGGHG